MTHTSTQTPAMAPVKMKVPMVPPRILPRRFILAMLPTAEAMDTNTRGTTIVNSRLRKMSPMGLMVVPKSGDDHADEGADQDAAEDENQVAVLLPEALLFAGLP